MAVLVACDGHRGLVPGLTHQLPHLVPQHVSEAQACEWNGMYWSSKLSEAPLLIALRALLRTAPFTEL